MVDSNKPGEALADDVLGFGGRELVTARHLILRPATVLQAWMEQGAEGGGLHARPLRLYLAMNAFLMLILFIRGGAGFLLEDLPPEMLAAMVERSGKSVDAFTADADGWARSIGRQGEGRGSGIATDVDITTHCNSLWS